MLEINELEELLNNAYESARVFSGKLKSRWSGPFVVVEAYPYRELLLKNLSDGTTFKLNAKCFDLSTTEDLTPFTYITSIIVVIKWETFCSHPGKINHHWVWVDNPLVFVREKLVSENRNNTTTTVIMSILLKEGLDSEPSVPKLSKPHHAGGQTIDAQLVNKSFDLPEAMASMVAHSGSVKEVLATHTDVGADTVEAETKAEEGTEERQELVVVQLVSIVLKDMKQLEGTRQLRDINIDLLQRTLMYISILKTTSTSTCINRKNSIKAKVNSKKVCLATANLSKA
ncbi:Detected protein of unknown function [Hibiscus syriacus]|uniref:Uncharacterized protein n=1 Tax=Hibiscus syriacus TaxID=106335 RepID=A0A6A2XGU2_HIBSY|nr:Detected protein of unknown function [Hibiscus syriacus]